MFEIQAFIDKVFLVVVRLKEFNAQDIFKNILPSGIEGEEKYYHEKQVKDALLFLEQIRFIKSQVRPEYTTNLRLTKEVRYGKVSNFGGWMAKSPYRMRYFYYWIYIKKNTFVSILAAFALLKLCYNAYLGILLTAGYIEYVYITIVLYVLVLAIRRAIS